MSEKIEHRFKIGELVEIEDGVRLYIAEKTYIQNDNSPYYSLTIIKGNYENQVRNNSDFTTYVPESIMKTVDICA